LIVLILAALAIFVVALAGMTFHQQYERTAFVPAFISVMSNGVCCVGLRAW
jgi:hypothetical protein